MTIGEVRTHTARIKHTCWYCGERIEPGERYVAWLWKDGRKVTWVKCHDECYEAWGKLNRYEREIDFAEFIRGCTCQRGDCRCNAEVKAGGTP